MQNCRILSREPWRVSILFGKLNIKLAILRIIISPLFIMESHERRVLQLQSFIRYFSAYLSYWRQFKQPIAAGADGRDHSPATAHYL